MERFEFDSLRKRVTNYSNGRPSNQRNVRPWEKEFIRNNVIKLPLNTIAYLLNFDYNYLKKVIRKDLVKNKKSYDSANEVRSVIRGTRVFSIIDLAICLDLTVDKLLKAYGSNLPKPDGYISIFDGVEKIKRNRSTVDKTSPVPYWFDFTLNSFFKKFRPFPKYCLLCIEDGKRNMRPEALSKEIYCHKHMPQIGLPLSFRENTSVVAYGPPTSSPVIDPLFVKMGNITKAMIVKHNISELQVCSKSKVKLVDLKRFMKGTMDVDYDFARRVMRTLGFEINIFITDLMLDEAFNDP